MQKEIRVSGLKFKYILKTSKRARRIRINVYRDRRAVVTLPSHLPVHAAERFVREKASWILKKLDFFHTHPMVPLPKERESYFLKYEAETLRWIKERITHFNQFYNFGFNRISVKNQKSQWGSCSGKKNISFNYKIIFLPAALRDYIIVHELCHLEELNHSKKFWNIVSQAIPDFAARKKKLRQYGSG